MLSKDISSSYRPSSGKSIFEYLEDPKAAAALPSLKMVLTELAALTEKSEVRLDEITTLVQADQGMSLRVLRMANSVYYAPTEPILNVHEAILYIGLSNFRGAVVSARCVEKTCHIKQDILGWKDFWTHAASVGRITMELASYLKEESLPEESFYLMGLLHDIGKVVLAQLMPEEFNVIYSRAVAERISPAALEMEAMGIDHGHLGSWYMQKQGMPPTLCDPVRFHHSPQLENKPFLKHAVLIQLADLIALWFHLGQSGNQVYGPDPFLSDNWKWYLESCRVEEADEEEFKQLILKQIAKTTELVRHIIV